MDRSAFQRWITRYEQLWRTPGTDGLASLFADEVTYSPSPWREPIVGLDAVASFWADGRDGPDESFTLQAEVVAVEADTGVARIAVDYAVGDRWRDLWVVHFDADGRCRAFEEWPFAPGQPDGQS